MTYEEFKDAVKVEQRIVDNDLELTISFTAKKRRRYPIEMFSTANIERIIGCQDNLIHEVWTFIQSEIGHTDKELKQAYLKGLRDGCRGFNDQLDTFRSHK